MTPFLLLLHGWAFDRHFWRPLQNELSDFTTLTWDLGFYGPPDLALPAIDQPIIVIGHSYGLLWLLQHRPLKWQAMVAINGFTRFPTGPKLDRMIAAFDRAPRATIESFRERCGAEIPAPHPFDAARLKDGLEHLRQWTQSSAEVDLALCGASDPILPIDHSTACFQADRVRWHPGGHLLPISAPVWCADQLRGWLT